MNTIELQNNIIRIILNITDEQLLDYLNNILTLKGKTKDVYKLNDFEKKVLSESLADYQNKNTINHDEVTSKIDKWLEK